MINKVFTEFRESCVFFLFRISFLYVQNYFFLYSTVSFSFNVSIPLTRYSKIRKLSVVGPTQTKCFDDFFDLNFLLTSYNDYPGLCSITKTVNIKDIFVCLDVVGQQLQKSFTKF